MMTSWGFSYLILHDPSIPDITLVGPLQFEVPFRLRIEFQSLFVDEDERQYFLYITEVSKCKGYRNKK